MFHNKYLDFDILLRDAPSSLPTISHRDWETNRSQNNLHASANSYRVREMWFRCDISRRRGSQFADVVKTLDLNLRIWRHFIRSARRTLFAAIFGPAEIECPSFSDNCSCCRSPEQKYPAKRRIIRDEFLEYSFDRFEDRFTGLMLRKVAN